MGFDVYGLAARSENGEYFRNNVWGWRRLWAFVVEVCPDILTDEDIENGSFNNGHTYSEKKALAIATRLEECLKDGRAKLYAHDVKMAIKEAKATNKGKKVGDKDYNWNEAYPFTITNVKEFAKFCKESGGFQIC